MTDFCIQVKNNRVMTSRIIAGDLDIIRFAGEEWIAIESFWDNFKKKIEYAEGEKLAFIIVSDNECFDVDSTILIAETFEHDESGIKWLIDGIDLTYSKVVLYPERLSDIGFATPLTIDPIVKDLIVKEVSKPDVIAQEVRGISLQNHYRKVTQDFKRGDKQ